jgi:hypothetical protein
VAFLRPFTQMNGHNLKMRLRSLFISLKTRFITSIALLSINTHTHLIQIYNTFCVGVSFKHLMGLLTIAAKVTQMFTGRREGDDVARDKYVITRKRWRGYANRPIGSALYQANPDRSSVTRQLLPDCKASRLRYHYASQTHRELKSRLSETADL